MMDLMQYQIYRAFISAINDIDVPETQNTMGNLPSNRNGPEPGRTLTENGIGNAWKNTNTKFTKKDSSSACGLREDTDFASYSLNDDYQFRPIRMELTRLLIRYSTDKACIWQRNGNS